MNGGTLGRPEQDEPADGSTREDGAERRSAADGIVIPAHRLPPGFAERLDHPEAAARDPAPARPAATAVPLRAGEHGLEVLLLERSRETGFVPGAYVFPGGRVDRGDAEPALLERVSLPGARPLEPEPGYWVAAARELFEETGILLAARGGVDVEPGWRERLLDDRVTMRELLDALELRLDLTRLVYCAHWVTPVVEPRRYDTRFFLARVPEDARVEIDRREMTDAVWLAPAAALARFEDGALPMVFPTVRTLESLLPFRSVAAALDAFAGSRVKRILPRLVRRAGGVAIVVDE